MKQTSFPYAVIHAILLLTFISCGSKSDDGSRPSKCDTIAFKHATNISMIDYGDYMKAVFRNPWDTTKLLQTYILVPYDKELPENLPDGTIVRTPLKRAIMYTSVHASLIVELGAVDAIRGTCDSKYMHKESLRRRIDDGRIVDCGSSRIPNLEKILSVGADAILLSAFENSNDHNKVGQLGLPIIDCIDYMEPTPLGRAEWMKFFGRLYGKAEKADSLFVHTENAYQAVKARTSNIDTRPIVLTDLIYGQAWHIPGGNSIIGSFIEDAGGTNPFTDYKKSGSVRLAPEEVLFKAKDADVWMIRYSQNLPPTLEQLGLDNPIYTKFKAYKDGEVYGCNSDKSAYFEDAAFHPHWILAEYVDIIHPELGPQEYNHHYYNKIER